MDVRDYSAFCVLLQLVGRASFSRGRHPPKRIVKQSPPAVVPCRHSGMTREGRSGASRDAFPSGAWERQERGLISVFCRLSSACAGVERSGRGFNPRPAQGRNAPPLPNVCLQFQIRKARMLLVECRSGSAGRGVPVGNNAGRGLNPRPERSTPAKYLLKLSNARNAPPPSICLRFRIRPPLPCPTLPISLAPPMLLRGWIIPVGGTTPDRHKVGTLPPCWLRGVQPPTGTRPTGSRGLLIKTPRRIFFAAIRGPSGAPSGPFGLQDLCAFRRLRRWPGCIFLKWRGIFRGSRRQR